MKEKTKRLPFVVLAGIMLMSLFSVTALADEHDLDDSIVVEKVEIDGTEVFVDDTVRLDLERDNTFDVRVQFHTTADLDDLELMGFISGYEYNDKERISDSTHTRDVEAGVTYVWKLKLTLPWRAEEDDYKLRLLFSDRYGEESLGNFNIKVDVPRHGMKIKDVIFSPYGKVQAGRALISTVRVENVGERDEDGVKIKVTSHPLGISSADYIDELESGESTTSEELYMRIPACAEAGTYPVLVEVIYDEGYERETWETQINVVDSDSRLCDVGGSDGENMPTMQPRTVISVGATSQNLVSGQGGAVYPITVSNMGSEAKTYSLTVDGTSDWASAKVSPSSTVIIDSEESKTLYVYLTANEDAAEGEHLFVATVSSGGEALKQLSFKGDVKAGSGKSSAVQDWDSVKRGLEIGLVVLVVLLVILGLIIGFNKLKGDDDDDDEEGQTYY